MGPEEAVKETFHQLIKMAILFGGVAILYIWIEKKLLKKLKKRKGARR
jgi:Na+-driven multidrug efflux pump